MPYLKIEDFSMYYEVKGSGSRTCVAVHGNLASSRWWQFLPPLLPDLQFVFMDLRGAGQSNRPASGYEISQYSQDLKCLSDHLGLVEFDLMGHSMGGQIAMQFACRFPKQVRTLTLVDTVPAEGLALGAEARQFFQLIRSDDKALRQAMFSCYPYLQNDGLRQQYWQEAYRCASEMYFVNPETMHETVLLAEVAKLSVPTLILHGREDVIIPVSTLASTITAFAKARVILLEQCGHSPFLEIPATAAALYWQFLQDCKEREVVGI